MLLDWARTTRAHRTPEATYVLRCFVSVLLCVAITFSAFLLGVPSANAQIEGRHDTVSVDGGSPSTWYRRGDPRVDKCAVGLDCELMAEDDFDLLEVVVRPSDEPRPLESVIAFSTQGRPAAPVRGPPCARDRV